MTTTLEDRLLGIALWALLLAAGGELLAVPLAVTLGVGAFFLALAGLLVSMTLTLLAGLTRLSGPDMRAPSVTDRRG